MISRIVNRRFYYTKDLYKNLPNITTENNKNNELLDIKIKLDTIIINQNLITEQLNKNITQYQDLINLIKKLNS